MEKEQLPSIYIMEPEVKQLEGKSTSKSVSKPPEKKKLPRKRIKRTRKLKFKKKRNVIMSIIGAILQPKLPPVFRLLVLSGVTVASAVRMHQHWQKKPKRKLKQVPVEIEKKEEDVRVVEQQVTLQEEQQVVSIPPQRVQPLTAEDVRDGFSLWGHIPMFLLVAICVLEGLRQVDPEDLGVVVKPLEDYFHYMIVAEKVLGLLLAWYLTIWITMTPRRSSTIPPQVTRQEPARQVNLTGTWIKDRWRSDSLSEVCKLANLNFFISKAVNLIKGLKMYQTEDDLLMQVFSDIPWFTLNEKFKFHGTTLNRRRDFRRGKMQCQVQHQEYGMVFNLSWKDPYCGHETANVVLVHPNEMHIHTVLTIGDKSVNYRHIYHKK